MTLVLVETDVARVNSYRSDQGTPVFLAWFPPPRSAAVPLFRGGGDTRSATYPVDDVHQTRIT